MDAGKEYDSISLLLSHTSPMHFLLPISFHDAALYQDAYSPLRSQSSVAIILPNIPAAILKALVKDPLP